MNVEGWVGHGVLVWSDTCGMWRDVSAWTLAIWSSSV